MPGKYTGEGELSANAALRAFFDYVTREQITILDRALAKRRLRAARERTGLAILAGQRAEPLFFTREGLLQQLVETLIRDGRRAEARGVRLSAFDWVESQRYARYYVRFQRLTAVLVERTATIDKMRREGCAAVGTLEAVFTIATSEGAPGADTKLGRIADLSSRVLVEASRCEHAAALAEREAESLRTQAELGHPAPA